MGLSTEGKEIMENGSHEANVYYLLGEKGEFQDKILEHPFGKIGIAKALSAGWIGIDKSSGSVRIVRKIDKIEDMVKKNLILIANNREEEVNQKFIQELKKRKLVIETNIKTYFVRKGSSFTIFLTKQEMDLTADMITSESWRMKTFKTYNFNAYGLLPNSGHLHPLMKVHYEFRQIFFQMGFSEMPTNRYIESSFWNFDALFQPQQHPARDVHDTFFLSDPATSDQFPEDYVQRVKEIHEKGGYGSKGYNYEWKIEEAQKNILRTHTTAVSAKQLYLLAQQVEGVIAERDLSLAHVMGLFTEFFRKCGTFFNCVCFNWITNLRFKPTYNPYTEPSMEIFAFHVGLNKWVEIGNSGMFRPEMLLPMGFPADVSVAGYGLSLERPTMIRYGIDNIRDLFGPKVDLEMVYRNPMCRLDKK
ncbi:unnamed protein product [Dracunculus medinensis]|uniref:phenylalanine--tRNA ligase n=1 Tax=Dracunculus medinensis TaxID=318479 RepID=A0A0N4UGD3_DRAME|nr:unnamed protein product [Dracunculus medinensis]